MLLRRPIYTFCQKKTSQESLTNLLSLIKNNPNLHFSSEKIESIMPEIEFSNDQKSLPYLKSLFYNRKNVYDIDYRDLNENNMEPFADGIFKQNTILKNMSEEEKQKVNLMADMKLQEIEESGLSRRELTGLESKPFTVFKRTKKERINSSQKRGASEVRPLLPVHQDEQAGERSAYWLGS